MNDTISGIDHNAAGFYSAQSLREMEVQLTTLRDRMYKLVEGFLIFSYSQPRAREYAQHGFGRRLFLMSVTIHNVFDAMPPNTQKPDDLSVVEINLQSFVFNVFGCVDNLAWVWALEKFPGKHDGTQFHRKQIGLSEKYKELRKTLSKEFDDLLRGCVDWFDYIEDFRHALAHRIPLYVPPYNVAPHNVRAHDELTERMWRAGFTGDPSDYEQLHQEREKLVSFKPVMAHSLRESEGVVPFHIQVLRDFATVETLGWQLLKDLA